MFIKRRKQVNSLAEHLERTGTPRKEFCAKYNISPSYLSLLLNRKRVVGKALALKIHSDTGIPLENLIQ